MPSFLRLWGEIKDTSFQPSLPFKAIKVSPILRTLGELGRNLWSWCRPKYSNFGSNCFFYDYFSLWIIHGGESGQVHVHPVSLKLLVSFQQFSIRALAVVLGLMSCSKAVLVQVLLFNLIFSCQREKTSRCHRGHIVGLLWNPAACQSLLHSKTFALSERLGSQSFSLHTGILGHLLSPLIPKES